MVEKVIVPADAVKHTGHLLLFGRSVFLVWNYHFEKFNVIVNWRRFTTLIVYNPNLHPSVEPASFVFVIIGDNGFIGPVSSYGHLIRLDSL